MMTTALSIPPASHGQGESGPSARSFGKVDNFNPTVALIRSPMGVGAAVLRES